MIRVIVYRAKTMQFVKALAKRRFNIAMLIDLDYVRNDVGIVATPCTMLVQ
jgi:hypothetical protein